MKLLILSLFSVVACTCLGADGTDQRTYSTARLFINNHKFGETNGCSQDCPASGKVTCGHPGHVTELVWKFLRSGPGGDVYQFMRKYPADTEPSTTETKEVTYTGKPIILWEDDYQKISLFPKSKP
jgi:hypothetical protein